MVLVSDQIRASVVTTRMLLINVLPVIIAKNTSRHALQLLVSDDDIRCDFSALFVRSKFFPIKGRPFPLNSPVTVTVMSIPAHLHSQASLSRGPQAEQFIACPVWRPAFCPRLSPQRSSRELGGSGPSTRSCSRPRRPAHFRCGCREDLPQEVVRPAGRPWLGSRRRCRVTRGPPSASTR